MPFGGLSEFVAYDEVRLPRPLDIDNGETPLRALHNRKVLDAIRGSDPGGRSGMDGERHQ